MKNLIVILLLVAVFSGFAQTEKAIKNAPLNYVKGLKSHNVGLVENMIFISTKYYLYYPDGEVNGVVKQLKKLIKNGPTESIRYKAFLACQMLCNDSLLKMVEVKNYKNEEQFFRIISSTLSQHYLAANDS